MVNGRAVSNTAVGASTLLCKGGTQERERVRKGLDEGLTSPPCFGRLAMQVSLQNPGMDWPVKSEDTVRHTQSSLLKWHFKDNKLRIRDLLVVIQGGGGNVKPLASFLYNISYCPFYLLSTRILLEERKSYRKEQDGRPSTVE